MIQVVGPHVYLGCKRKDGTIFACRMLIREFVAAASPKKPRPADGAKS